jgi:Fuc2NAc and GlcNAc transferase
LSSEQLFYSSATVALSAYLCCWVYPVIAKRFSLFALVNARSAHLEPTPTGAGVVFSFFSLVFIYLCFIFGSDDLSLVIALLASITVGLIGFTDDIFDLSVKVRLPLYMLAAIWCVFWVGVPDIALLGWTINSSVIGSIFGVLFLLWVQNLFNFMDGIDGIVASEVIFVCFSAWFFIETNTSYEALICLLVGSLAVGFLFRNWPSAKLFMGDAGANFLGLTIGLLALNSQELSFWVWLVLMSQFLVDGTLTLIVRFYSGDDVSQAHSKHAYQNRNRRFGTSKALVYSILVNVLWVLPMAVLAERLPEYGLVLLISAAIPIALADFMSGSGNNTARIKWLKA